MSKATSRAPGALDRLSFEILLALLAVAALVLLLAPTVIVLVVSFTDGMSLRFPPPGYSLRWYGELAEAWQLHFALKNSLTVAVLATLVSVVLGVLAALAVARSPRLAARLLDSLFLSPLILPALAFGLSSLMFFSALGWPVSVTTLVIGHTIVCVPYVMRNTVAALTQLQPALLEGSASLGASRLYTLRRITLPLIRPGILSGGFLAFMASFDNIPVSLFLRDAATDMLPIRMWQDLEGRLDVTIAALSGVLIVATIAVIALMERLTGLSKRLV
ncbi:ABC transporter permease [Methylobacterium sp. ID0610]|uniref:ABC transporter permease n=1 Tax=Methylobacterium carpenticola TaxID=3344827 RepID=UPI0036D0528F